MIYYSLEKKAKQSKERWEMERDRAREQIPFLRCLRRAERASRTRLTGKIILCQISINLSFTLVCVCVPALFFFFFLLFLLCLSGTAILFNPARPLTLLLCLSHSVNDSSLTLCTHTHTLSLPFTNRSKQVPPSLHFTLLFGTARV